MGTRPHTGKMARNRKQNECCRRALTPCCTGNEWLRIVDETSSGITITLLSARTKTLHFFLWLLKPPGGRWESYADKCGPRWGTGADSCNLLLCLHTERIISSRLQSNLHFSWSGNSGGLTGSQTHEVRAQSNSHSPERCVQPLCITCQLSSSLPGQFIKELRWGK